VTYPYGEVITVWREVRDRFGDTTVVDERQIGGVALAPRTSAEDGADRRTAVVTSGLTLYASEPTGLDATWRIRRELDGTVWTVEGNAGLWSNPLTGWAPGEQLQLRRVTG
jgi:hypothetical protein